MQVVLTESMVTKIIDVKPAAMGITAEVWPLIEHTTILQHPTGEFIPDLNTFILKLCLTNVYL